MISVTFPRPLATREQKRPQWYLVALSPSPFPYINAENLARSQRFDRVKRSLIKLMLASKHSCTLTPTFSAPGSALMTNAAFSKAVVEVLELIAVPPFSLIQFALIIQGQ